MDHTDVCKDLVKSPTTMQRLGGNAQIHQDWALMRALLPILIILTLMLGCQKKSHLPLVVEDATPVVGVDHKTTAPLGIETLGGVFTPLIKAGTKVPCSHSEIFSTAADGQTQIMVAPFRGTNQLIADNHALGRFKVTGIPTAPRGVPQIEVTFTITERQILVSARDLKRNTDLEIHSVPRAAKN